MIKLLLLSFLLLLVSCGISASDKAKTLKKHHELCDEWLNTEQTEREAANSFHPYEGLGLKWERGWTEVDRYCKVLKGSTEEF